MTAERHRCFIEDAWQNGVGSADGIPPAGTADVLSAAGTMRENWQVISGLCGCITEADGLDAPENSNEIDLGLLVGIRAERFRHASVFEASSRAGMVLAKLPSAGANQHVLSSGNQGSSSVLREPDQHTLEYQATVEAACERTL